MTNLSQTMKQRSLLVLIILAIYEGNWVEPNFNPSYVPFMSYVLLESKAQTMAQFKSTLLDLHALLQVFVISLAHVKNVRSPLILWSSNGRPFWIFFIIDLVIGPFNGLGLGLGLEGAIAWWGHIIISLRRETLAQASTCESLGMLLLF